MEILFWSVSACIYALIVIGSALAGYGIYKYRDASDASKQEHVARPVRNNVFLDLLFIIADFIVFSPGQTEGELFFLLLADVVEILAFVYTVGYCSVTFERYHHSKRVGLQVSIGTSVAITILLVLEACFVAVNVAAL